MSNVTRAAYQRYMSGRIRLTDPCVICGGKLEISDWNKDTGKLAYRPGHEPWNACGHTMEDTMSAIKVMKRMKQADIDKLKEKS